MTEMPLHPELNLPYGKWIPIAYQRRNAAIWQPYFSGETMALIEKLHEGGQAFILQCKLPKLPKGQDGKAYERRLWLKIPSEIARRLHVDR